MRLKLHAVALLLTVTASTVSAQSEGVRQVMATRDVIPLYAKLRYQTMVILPDGEQILDVLAGDKEFWQTSAVNNILAIKPSKEGAASNMNVVSSSGEVYSFLLSEGKRVQPDLKVYITSDQKLTPTAGRAPYYTKAHVDALEAELTSARAAIDTAAAMSAQAVAAFKKDYPTSLRFPYTARLNTKPFFCRNIWHDESFTYIKCNGRERPALFEYLDDKPSAMTYQVKDGTFVVPKVLSRFYLALGDQRLHVTTED